MHSRVGTFKDNTFIVIWVGDEEEEADYTGIFGQKFDQKGEKVGSEFHVNTVYTFSF